MFSGMSHKTGNFSLKIKIVISICYQIKNQRKLCHDCQTKFHHFYMWMPPLVNKYATITKQDLIFTEPKRDIYKNVSFTKSKNVPLLTWMPQLWAHLTKGHVRFCCNLTYVIIPPANKVWGGGYIGFTLSVRLSVCPHRGYMVCPRNSSYSFSARKFLFCRSFVHISKMCMW